MTDEMLGTLFEAFANFYWCLPVSEAVGRLTEWYPDLSARQVDRVLKRCAKDVFWHHCTVIAEKGEEPQIVTEHLVVLGDDDLERFLAVRIDAPFFKCDEAALLRYRTEHPDIPEARAIIDFGKTELGLDDEWAVQLADDCVFHYATALFDGKSWVMSVLQAEKFGKIRFRTIEQVEQFRTLGNKLYQVFPNPVLRGWKPAEIDHPPVLKDDIPDKAEDIPDMRPEMDKLFAPLGGREKAGQMLMDRIAQMAANAPKRKIGRNELCPCGSGKKYKRCCGR